MLGFHICLDRQRLPPKTVTRHKHRAGADLRRCATLGLLIVIIARLLALVVRRRRELAMNNRIKMLENDREVLLGPLSDSAALSIICRAALGAERAEKTRIARAEKTGRKDTHRNASRFPLGGSGTQR